MVSVGYRLLFIMAICFQVIPVVASSPVSRINGTPPQLYYSDLLNGPSRGGENGGGAFVTIYGRGFGDVRGTSIVTIAGEEVFAYPQWSDKRITIQLGRNAQSGLVIAHISGCSNSNALPFTVRDGHIYFVALDGNDHSNGSFSTPWKTIVAAKNRLRPGDVVYVMNGVVQDSLDKYDSSLSIQMSGSADRPIAIVAYPGAKVTIGSAGGPQIAARTPNIDRTSDHWVLAGLTFVGAQEALDITASTDWRIVGNDFSCPNGFGPTGCIEIGQATQIKFWGNTVHDVAKPGTTKQYHAVYFTTDSNHIDVGWNTIANVRGCRGIQFHSSPLDAGTGMNQFDLRVHDNIIHDVVCDGINLATIDPSKGPIEVYNNLIYNVGTGPDPEDGSSNYACIYVQGGSNAGAPGSGTVQIYNNTMYNCGGRRNTDSGVLSLSAGSPLQIVLLRNNIIDQRNGVPLLSPNSTSAPLRLDVNISWPASITAQLDMSLRRHLILRDPLLRDPQHGDFSVQEHTAASDFGMGATPHMDQREASR